MSNNNDIIANIMNKINSKKDIKDNVINYFFIENNNINNIFPNVRYSTDDISNFSNYINLPINKFKGINNFEEEKSLDIGDKVIKLTNGFDDYYLSERDVISKNILENQNLINGNNIGDINEFIDISSDIIQYAENYKETLNDISGKDFETLFSVIAQGNNIKNINSLKHIPFEKIGETIEKEQDDKAITNFLKTKKVFKYNYDVLKNIYSTRMTSKTLFEVYGLDDPDRELYVDNISVYGGAGVTKDKKVVSPKTDVTITFFVLDKKHGDLKTMFEHAERFNSDTLNISLKQDDYYGYQNIISDKDNINKSLYEKLSSVSNTTIAKNILNDIHYNIFRIYPLDFVEEVRVLITHKQSVSSAKNVIVSNKKLGDFCPGDKRVLVKLMYGSFVNYQANSNAFLSVKNKSDVFGINKVMKLIKPISFLDEELIKYLEGLNVVYIFSMKEMLNIFNKNVQHNTHKQIYSGKIIDVKIINYLFKGSDDINDFFRQVHRRVNGNIESFISFDKVKNMVYDILRNDINSTVYNTINNIINDIKSNEVVKIEKKQNVNRGVRNYNKVEKRK